MAIFSRVRYHLFVMPLSMMMGEEQMSDETCRRDFLKVGLAAAAAVVGGPAVLLGAGPTRAGRYPDLVIAQGTSPGAMTRSAVEALGGIKRFVKPGNKVVIKPNMSFASRPGGGRNTHPEVIAEIARMCHEAGASAIGVLDNTLQSPRDCLSMSGIPAACEAIPNTVVANIKAKRRYEDVNVPDGVHVKKMAVMKHLLEADILIAAPVGKSHGATKVSVSMKGMMGLIRDRRSFHGRNRLHEAIVDMVTLLKPHLVVVDGTSVLSTGGPRGPGKVIKLDRVIASTDMVAADAQMVRLGTWYGKKIQPAQVKHIRIAAERGLGRLDLENLTVKELRV